MDDDLAVRHIISQPGDQRGPARHGMVSTASGVVSRILFGVLDNCSSDGPRSLDLRVSARVISNSRVNVVTAATPAGTRGGLKSSLAARAWCDTGCHFPRAFGWIRMHAGGTFGELDVIKPETTCVIDVDDVG